MENCCRKEPVSNFDLSKEISGSYFKSSFARSMAFSNTNQSKSLDYVYYDRETIEEEVESDVKIATDDSVINKRNFLTNKKNSFSKSFDQSCENGYLKFSGLRNNIQQQESDKNGAAKPWNYKQVTLKRNPSIESNRSRGHSGQEEVMEDQLLKLQKECQDLAEENRRLQQTSAASHLQTQVDTLQWQLKQTESSRQMYRAVMEQVSKFLERVHKNLELMQNKSPQLKSKARVPRSRSVHTVVSSNSRPSSPCPSTVSQSNGVHRANSITQIQESPSYSAFRDMTWRVPRGATVDEVPPEKLSQEAFRLLRTVQSLLGTREPDLAYRLTPVPGATPDIVRGDSRNSSWLVGSCSSLLQSSCGGQRKSLDSSSCSSQAPMQCPSDEVEVECEAEVVVRTEEGNSSTPQLSVGSTEDESGFSSMSSFHEVGLPEIRNYPEVGLPIVEAGHRRWSSTPVSSNSSYCAPGESIRVLWV